MGENYANPKGYGFFRADTPSLLLEVAKLLLRRRFLSRAKGARIAAGCIIKMGSGVAQKVVSPYHSKHTV